jgi:hemerythrin-like domain-containing protein
MDPYRFYALVHEELTIANLKNGKMISDHEAYAVFLEELEEYWEEVRKKREQRDRAKMLRELIQIAAMATKAAQHLHKENAE